MYRVIFFFFFFFWEAFENYKGFKKIWSNRTPCICLGSSILVTRHHSICILNFSGHEKPLTPSFPSKSAPKIDKNKKCHQSCNHLKFWNNFTQFLFTFLAEFWAFNCSTLIGQNSTFSSNRLCSGYVVSSNHSNSYTS